MKTNFEKVNLYSCPIYKSRIDPNSYDKEKIINDILYNKSLKNTRNNTFKNDDTHHSYHDFDNEEFRPINYEKLIVVYKKIFDIFFNEELATIKQFNFEFEIVNYSAITEGQYLSSHNHIESDFAVVHYLNFKDDHDPTMFTNPASFAPFLKYLRPELFDILDHRVGENQYMADGISWKMEEDDMIIFPSAINHEIMPQKETKEPRITISTNIKILPQEGGEPSLSK